MSYLFSCSEENPNWKVSEDGKTVLNGSEVVADVHGTNTEFYSEFTQEANARLIAEAPAMYRLLDHLSAVYMHYRDEDKKSEVIEGIVEEYRKLRYRAACEYTTLRMKQVNQEEEE